MGESVTEGRGAGNKPEIGREAAKENIDDLKKVLGEKTKMVFVTAGMGGGTGTGAGPVIARSCSEEGLLTVAIVTLPFRNEGRKRISQAIEGIKEMESFVDSLLVINNEKIREMYGDFKISEAFSKADDVLGTAAKGIAEIITVHGYINVDFADVETVMRNSGVSVMGSARASGENRAVKAVEEALNSPLLNNNNIKGARNILLNVTSGSEEVTMDEIGQITDFVQSKAGYDADLIWGNGVDQSLEDELSVTIIATGFSTSSIPEILATETKEKEYHSLIENEVARPKTGPSKTKSNYSQGAIKFEVDRPRDEFSSLYTGVNTPATENDTIEEKVSFEVDFSEASDDELNHLDSIPAYKRRKFHTKASGEKANRKVSRITLSADDNDDIFFSENSPYIHEKPD